MVVSHGTSYLESNAAAQFLLLASLLDSMLSRSDFQTFGPGPLCALTHYEDSKELLIFTISEVKKLGKFESIY